jgi:UDP-N-acetylglucosamine 2-epimerase (hydrolysing)
VRNTWSTLLRNPIINIGTRQQNRAVHADIINVDYDEKNISEALKIIDLHVQPTDADFGQGNSAELFWNHCEKRFFGK